MLAQFVFLFFARDFPRNLSPGPGSTYCVGKIGERSELSGELEGVKPPFPLPQTTARLASLADIFYFLFFAFQTQAREISTEMDVKTVNVIVKNKSQQFSMVCDLIDHGLCSETKRLRLVVSLAFFEHSDIISMVDKSTDHAKLLFIC